jgi:hypothetical protein
MVLISILSITTHAQDEKRLTKVIPHHSVMQYAGNIGVLSIGLGYKNFRDKMETNFFYGYVPAMNGGKEIHTVAVKNQYNFRKNHHANNWYGYNSTGLTLQISSSENTFFKLPSYYPKGYYAPNNFHASLFVGRRLVKEFQSNNLVKAAGVYVELNTLDSDIYYLITNKKINYPDVNIAIGHVIYFK